MFKKTLAIETSCDDTSVSIVDYTGYVFAVLSANQDDAHKEFGGVVPEIASRNHTTKLIPLIDKLMLTTNTKWTEIDVISVTSRPGLVGSLLAGLVTAKTLSLSKNIPFYSVNHLEGHILAPFLRDNDYKPLQDFGYPYISLAVSGGHTQLYYVESLGSYKIMGKTIDDAAGEAFDKFAKMVGLGFPGGVAVDKMAKKGDPNSISFPRPLSKENNFDFSFSGLKTAALRYVDSITIEERKERISDISASLQEAIVDSLLIKLERARALTGVKYFSITGGVSANSRLRAKSQEWAEKNNCLLAIPPLRYCTDNAAMIGFAALQRLNNGAVTSEHTVGPSPKPYKEDFQYYERKFDQA